MCAERAVKWCMTGCCVRHIMRPVCQNRSLTHSTVNFISCTAVTADVCLPTFAVWPAMQLLYGYIHAAACCCALTADNPVCYARGGKLSCLKQFTTIVIVLLALPWKHPVRGILWRLCCSQPLWPVYACKSHQPMHYNRRGALVADTCTRGMHDCHHHNWPITYPVGTVSTLHVTVALGGTRTVAGLQLRCRMRTKLPSMLEVRVLGSKHKRRAPYAGCGMPGGKGFVYQHR